MHQRLDYWVLNKRLMPLMIDEIVLEQPLAQADRKIVHITVRTGTGNMTEANVLAKWLTARGFTVNGVVWANRHTHVRNQILDFTGDKYLVARLKAAIGITASDTTVVESPYHDYSGLDMVITVGRDFHLNAQMRP